MSKKEIVDGLLKQKELLGIRTEKHAEDIVGAILNILKEKLGIRSGEWFKKR